MYNICSYVKPKFDMWLSPRCMRGIEEGCYVEGSIDRNLNTIIGKNKRGLGYEYQL